MEKITNIDLEKVDIKQSEYIDDKAVGCIDNTDTLYLIDRSKKEAYRLPDKYKNTNFDISSGYDDSGMIMVSMLGKIDLQYYHECCYIAGMWGWIDIYGNEIIAPKYVYATNFDGDYAIVCKGQWTIDNQGKYWCENEQWGVIDKNENEIVPLKYDDEIHFLSEDKVAVKNGHYENDTWIEGTWRIFDIKLGKEIFEIEEGTLRYSEYKDEYITICNERENESEVYVYDFKENKYLFKGEGYEDIEIIGRDKFKLEK